jgi:N-acetylmuramoyl-L-alanine amidase
MHKHLLKLFLLISFISVAQTPEQTVIAVRGDGIYSILRKHNLNPRLYYKSFIALNKKNLTKANGVFIGKTYILPKKEDTVTKIDTITSSKIKTVISTKVTETNNEKAKPNTTIAETEEHLIFGKEHAKVEIKDNDLKGTIYYLISGHGGPDPGATTQYNGKLITEDEYAYDVTLRLAKRLLSHGAKVYIIIQDANDGIRDKRILEVDYDEVNYPNKKISRSQKLRLKQRTQAVNKLFLKHGGKYQRLIVTHVDSRSKGKNIDVFFYHHKNSKKGKRLAEHIHNSFKQKYAKYQPNRTYSGTVGSRGLYLVRNTLPAMVYIELGNIRNAKDQKRILNYENREALANWICNGLLKDYKNQ